MSDDAKCEGCGKLGRRPRRYLAPRDWLYLEVHEDDAEDDPFIVWACSETCAKGMWKPGPGPRQDLLAPRVDPGGAPRGDE